MGWEKLELIEIYSEYNNLILEILVHDEYFAPSKTKIIIKNQQLQELKRTLKKVEG